MTSPRRAGFTLLEILVATTILALIVIVLASLVSQAGKIWHNVDAFSQRRSVGRSMLQFIVRDLEGAVLQSNPLTTNAANLQFIVNLSSNASNETKIPSSLLNPHAAFWQAPVAINKTRGDLAEVGYFVRWQPTNGIYKPLLCRFLVEPSETNGNFLIYGNTNGEAVNWVGADTITNVAPATSGENYKGWFADNVIALWIRCADNNGSAISTNANGVALGYGFDSRQGYRYVNPSGVLSTNMPSALPPAVDVALVTVDSRTAQKITQKVYDEIRAIYPDPAAPEDFGKDKNTRNSLAYFMDKLPSEIKSGSQVFTTRAYLKNGAK